jgi:hypothetical protein
VGGGGEGGGEEWGGEGEQGEGEEEKQQINKNVHSAKFSTIICFMYTDLRSHIHNKYLLSDLTFSPGQWLYQAAKHCECCAPTPAAAPFGPRKTIGTFTYTIKICSSQNVFINYSECNWTKQNNLNMHMTGINVRVLQCTFQVTKCYQ